MPSLRTLSTVAGFAAATAFVSLLMHRSAPASTPLAAKAGACVAAATGSKTEVDAGVRTAAHKGLLYLGTSSQEWTKKHQCFGCHVQAVTLEALSIGKQHQYQVSAQDLGAMVRALKLGVKAGGHATGVAFEGSAWARYDQWVGNNETPELLTYAKELTAIQNQSGAIVDDDRRLPVTGGTLQTTFQAAQTWRQAYARTADDKWLPPLRKAEAFLAAQSASWKKSPESVYLQDLNFALLGLLASGVTRNEASARGLVDQLLSRQHHDGGWGLDKNPQTASASLGHPGAASGEAASDAFATGQTVYTLKMAGFADDHPAVARGISYLVSRQDQSGAWRTYRSGQGGAEKAETMWAVLGLVTVDVASLAITGVVDGQHVEPQMRLSASAADNQGGGIQQLELLVDDVSVATSCGSKLAHALDTRKLTTGKHVIDLVAVTGKGHKSRRRFEVYAGEVFLTELGAHFDEASRATLISLRNIAPPSEEGGRVELEVFSTQEGGEAKPKDKVYSAQQVGTSGGLSLTWNGTGSDGKSYPPGRYLARLTFRDKSGKVRQTDSTQFFHDSEAAQRAKYAEVQGQISLRSGINSANTKIELVDERGNVVQTTRTTEQGNYRFKSVDKGSYRVRVKKDGFADQEAAIQAAPAAAPATASMTL